MSQRDHAVTTQRKQKIIQGFMFGKGSLVLCATGYPSDPPTVDEVTLLGLPKRAISSFARVDPRPSDSTAVSRQFYKLCRTHC